MNISVTHQNARRAAFGVEMTPGYYYPGYPHLSVDGNYRLMSTLEDTLRCDGCGASFGAWDKCGAWHAVDDTGPLNSGYDGYLFGRYPDLELALVRVARGSNGQLSAYCQSCWKRRAPAAVRRDEADAERERQRATGQRELFGGAL